MSERSSAAAQNLSQQADRRLSALVKVFRLA
jgi:hypothetical protein